MRNPTSTVINQTVADIQSNGTPLRTGEVPVPTSVVQVVGELTIFQNATVISPEGTQYANMSGYMRLVGVVVLDQGCNIMVNQNMTIQESITPDSPDAKTLAAEGRIRTSSTERVTQQANGVFTDVQIRAPGRLAYDIKTTQDSTIRSGTKDLFKIEGTNLRLQDATKTITVTPGTVKRIP